MSCFAGNQTSLADRDSLLAEKLYLFTNKFHNVRYPAIIDANGDMITPLNSIDDFPPEYTSYIFTLKSLAERVLKIFCTSNCQKLKVRGENQALFSVYNLDSEHFLAFYCDIDPDVSKAVDPTGNDDSFPDVLADIKKILSTPELA